MLDLWAEKISAISARFVGRDPLVDVEAREIRRLALLDFVEEEDSTEIPFVEVDCTV